MLKNISYLSICLITCMILAGSTGCMKTIQVSSGWRSQEIVIDGMGDEWGNTTIYVPEAKIALTLFNDSDFFYMRMHTRDREVQTQVLRSGLTVWFDPNGGKNEILGIHYPLQARSGSHPPPHIGMRETQDMMAQMVRNLPDVLEILALGNDHGDTLSAEQVSRSGIAIELGFEQGNLIYELKVPLRQTKQHPFAIGLTEPRTDEVSVIGIGFKTPKMDVSAIKDMMKEEKPEDLPEGKPMTGSMPTRPPDDPGAPEPLKLWISVKLNGK